MIFMPFPRFVAPISAPATLGPSRTSRLVALLVLVLALLVFNLVYLAANFASRIGRVRRSRRRDGMDIRIGRIGFERHHQGVEVAGHNILPRDRLDVSPGPRPG